MPSASREIGRLRSWGKKALFSADRWVGPSPRGTLTADTAGANSATGRMRDCSMRIE